MLFRQIIEPTLHFKKWKKKLIILRYSTLQYSKSDFLSKHVQLVIWNQDTRKIWKIMVGEYNFNVNIWSVSLYQGRCTLSHTLKRKIIFCCFCRANVLKTSKIKLLNDTLHECYIISNIIYMCFCKKSVKKNMNKKYCQCCHDEECSLQSQLH